MKDPLKRAVALRHVPFENLGSFETVLKEHGYSVEYLEAPTAVFTARDLLPADLLIVLGGPLSVNDTTDFPFLRVELEAIRYRMERDLPTLGICLGAQLMAKAMGGKVKAGKRPEIGWEPLTLTEEGRRSPLQFLDPSLTSVFHWHGEVYEVPIGGKNLASTEMTESQAFSYGKNSLGLQFHPEVTAIDLESWFVGHIHELNSLKIPVQGLREKTVLHSKTLLPAAKVFFAYWLDSLSQK